MKNIRDFGDTLVQLNEVGLQREGRWLVRGVDLEVKRGEIVTLIGPNGSGKSTSAKLALGLIEPQEGSRFGKPGLTVGYVPQKIAIDWTLPLTVKRFLRLTNGLSKAAIDAAMERTNVAHLADRQLRILSGGEFQRVLLARAIARKPDLLVLDEPVQGVDFSGEIALYELIASIRDELNCGVLMISHDLHMVMAATDQVICLNGHVCCKGTPASVVQSSEYQELFGARANPVLAMYQHDHDHTHLPDGRVKHRDGSIADDCGDHGHADAHSHSHGKGGHHAG